MTDLVIGIVSSAFALCVALHLVADALNNIAAAIRGLQK